MREFIAGLFLGVILGFVLAALLCVGKRGDGHDR